MSELDRVMNAPGMETPTSPTSTFEIVFDGPPGPVAGRFVDVEDAVTRAGLNVGTWIDRGDGYWALRITVPDVHTVDVDGKIVTLTLPEGHHAENADELAQAYLDAGAALVRVVDTFAPAATVTVTDPDDPTAPGGRERDVAP